MKANRLVWILFLTTRLSAQTIITQPTNQTVVVGSDVTFSVAVSGSGPFTYQWQFNGANITNGIISTVAGNGTAGFSGDGGLATNAALNGPYSGVVDAFGNLFIADYSNDRIRKVTTNGIITTVAGKGSFGYSGDGGNATNAQLKNPDSVRVDASGNLFIADSINCRIRKVTTNGIITTVAGNGSFGYSGDSGSATNAAMNDDARGLAVDASGNLFFADCGNQRIRKVTTNGIITTVAGNGVAGYSGDGGSATGAKLNYPSGVAVDVIGNLFISDSDNN
jgi:hypothetical protein